MRLNAFFPTRDIGTDPAKIRDWAQAAEDLGYAYIEVPDHVFGAKARDGWVPLYNEKDSFHETFVTLGFLAAVTRTIGLSSGILIAPQRQTGVIAKQAAEVDILSGGRLRLGIGVGWNHVEYEALGAQWKTRGARSEEQIEVLRLLWTQEVVTYSGRWHQISHAGLNPRPIQRPIPIWIGSGAPQTPLPPEAGMRRIARLADGWFPLFDLHDQGKAVIARIRQYTEEAGRDPGALGLEGRVNLAGTGPDDWIKAVQGWEAVGATHLSVSTGGKVFHTPQEHLEALRRFKHEVGL